MPRRELSAFTATLPLCEIIATGPAGSGWTASPQIAVLCANEMIPLPFGPQTGNARAERGLAQLALELAAALDLAEAGRDHDRAAATGVGRGLDRRRHVRRGHRDRDGVGGLGQLGERGEARDARGSRSRRGFTPQTGPSKPIRSRLRRMMSPYALGRSVAPTTAMERGSSSRSSSITYRTCLRS